jgi:hypothetical protein
MKYSSQAVLILLSLPLLQQGCISIGSSEPQKVQEVRIQGAAGGPGITVGGLDQLARNYADRLVARVSAACDALKREPLPEEARVQAQRLRLSVALAAYDVVTAPAGTPHVPDAAQHLLDLAILTELLAIRWVDEGGGRDVFGERGEKRLTEAFGSSRENVWELARLAMDPEQIDLLKNLVQEWRRQNPRFEGITRVRLDEIVAGKEGAEFTRSVVEKFTPLEAALRAVDEARLLGQQSFFYLKRLPLILDWTMEVSVSDALSVPKVGTLIEGLQDTLSGIARTTTTFEHLMESSSQEPAVNSTLEALRESLVQARELSREARWLEEILHSSPPADIGKAATQVGDGAREATLLMRETRALAESPAAVQNVDRMLARSSKAIAQGGQDVIDHLTIRVLEILLVVLVVILLSAALSRLLRKRRAAAASPPPW